MAPAATTPEVTAASRRPNFLFILVDDLGWRDLSCYGSPFYETPHLDRLASQSMRFTDAYAACNVCSPTRASILTGKYPARLGVTDWIGAGAARGAVQAAPYVHYLPLTEKTIASSLRDAGYATWHVGKWHLGDEPYWPQHQGFDTNVGGTANGGTRSFFSPYSNPMLPDGPKGEFLPDRLTDEAIQLIKANKATGKPFFLNMWHFLVHIPIQPKPEYVPKYVEKAKLMGLDKKKAVVPGEYDHVFGRKDKRMWVREFQSSPQYAAFIQSLDESVGRLLATLEEEGLADNTVVIFTSDNGGASTHDCSTSNAPLKYGKGWTYDGGVREPLLIRWPGKIAPNTLCAVPVTSPDFYPTMLQMADLPLLPEQHKDGVSLLPLLQGSDHLDREAIFWHYPHYSAQGGAPACAVRSGDYKLIRFFEDDHLELYNLRTDLGEEHDLAKANPDVAGKLNTILDRWLAQVGAKIPHRDPQFKASEYPWTYSSSKPVGNPK